MTTKTKDRSIINDSIAVTGASIVIENNTDEEESVSILWKGLYEMAFMDIKRASNGNAKMGAFILASCLIDSLARIQGKLIIGIL